MWRWTHDTGVLYKVLGTLPLTGSHMPTASCGRKGEIQSPGNFSSDKFTHAHSILWQKWQRCHLSSDFE